MVGQAGVAPTRYYLTSIIIAAERNPAVSTLPPLTNIGAEGRVRTYRAISVRFTVGCPSTQAASAFGCSTKNRTWIYRLSVDCTKPLCYGTINSKLLTSLVTLEGIPTFITECIDDTVTIIKDCANLIIRISSKPIFDNLNLHNIVITTITSRTHKH